MNPDAVLFDLDFTLCQRCWSPDAVLTEAFDRVDIDPYCTATDMIQAASEVSTVVSYIEFYTHCLEAAAERNGTIPERAPAVADAYHSAIDYADVEFLPGVETALTASRANSQVGVVTNGSERIQTEKLASLDIEDIFDALVFATPEGVKPDSYPFERALDALGAVPEKTIHIGDSLRADVAGANAMGIRSVWIPHNEAESVDGIEPDHTLDSLADLPALLNEI